MGKGASRNVGGGTELLSVEDTPEAVAALAEKGYAPPVRPRVNTHVHLPPNFSAFETVEQGVALAAEQGLGVLGASNYYHFGVYAGFAAQARARNIFPLFGLEVVALIDELVRRGVRVNDPGNPGKMYLCGKGITRFDTMTPEARRLIGVVRRSDSRRMAEAIARLTRIFDAHGVRTGVDENAVIDMVVHRHGCPREWVYLQERHVAQALQEAFFRVVEEDRRSQHLSEIFGAPNNTAPDDSVAIQDEIRSHLMKAGKPAYVEETFINFEQAYRLVLELGGIPCYPTLADGTSPICEYEQDVDKLVERLRAANIHCVEFIPVRNMPQVLARYVKAMREAGLVVTAGTEHNTLELLPLEPACVGGRPIPQDIQEIFWEGGCVVAAHQFLTLSGRCGFVDRQGNPNPAYGTDEERIEAYRALGAAVIQQYYESNRESEGATRNDEV